MVGNRRGSHEEKIPTGGVTQNRRKSRRSKVKQSQVSSFDRRRSGWFSAARMAGERRSASKLQIGTKLGQNGGRKWEIWPGQGRGSGRVFGSKIGSVDSFSLSLCYTCISFLCFQLIPLLINSLTASYHFTFTGITILPPYKNFILKIYVPDKKR